MKKGIVRCFVIVSILAILGYAVYFFYFPQMVAEAIVSDNPPAYIPKRIQNRIDEFRIPINKGVEDVVSHIHEANIPIEEVLEAIDETSEEEAYLLLEELNQTKIRSADQVFTITKQHLDTDFDMEIFRKPFTENVDIKLIQKWIKYANVNRKTKDIDIETARAIVKQVLIEKEKEFKKPKTSNHYRERSSI